MQPFSFLRGIIDWLKKEQKMKPHKGLKPQKEKKRKYKIKEQMRQIKKVIFTKLPNSEL